VRISLQFFSFFLLTFLYLNEFFLYSSLFDSNDLRFSNSVELTFNGVLASLMLHFFYVFTFLVLFIFFRLPNNNSIEALKRGMTRNVLFLFFTVVSLVKVNSILSAGLADYILQTRSNEGGIGGLTYIVLIGWPVLMLVYETSRLEKVISWTILVVLNLMTGFRIILLMSILLHFVHLLRRRSYNLNFNAMLLLTCLLLTSFFFSLARLESSSIEGSFVLNFLNSLNRSNSVLTVAYAYDRSILFPMNGFLELAIQPIQAFIGYFSDSVRWTNDYEIKVFSEFFYKNFLYLRGSEFYYASGFSNTIILVLFSHFGFACLAIIPIFLFLVSYFLFFYQVTNIYSHTSVSLLYTFFLISSIESFSVGFGYLFYGLIFIIFLRTFRFTHLEIINF
jgi:hypothetical protein